jgi:DnaJ-domain-containing protein 1
LNSTTLETLVVVVVMALVGFFAVSFVIDRFTRKRAAEDAASPPPSVEAEIEAARASLRPRPAASPRRADAGERPWWEVLDVGEASSDDEIERAYRAGLARYDPNRMDGLGTELVEVARTRTAEIERAWAQAQAARRR